LGDDDVYLEVHELARKRGEAIECSFRRAPLNEDVFPLLVAELAQFLAKRLAVRAGLLENGLPVKYPIRGSFVGCCADAE